MAIQVDTKDCTSLSDADLEEMAELCDDEPSRYEIGVLSKEVESWVLVSLAREGEKLKGFSFFTLERIGGTPSVLVGLARVKRCSKRSTILNAIVTEKLRRAVLAFPDEDVLIGTRFIDPAGFDALKNLNDIVPRPDHKASGEERAWGRRLAKRFGIDASNYEDRSFTIVGDGDVSCALDYETAKPEDIDPEVAALFSDIDATNGGALIGFGWAMAEDLDKYAT